MKIQPKLIQLLNKRGIVGDSEISEFLSDKPQRTYDPFLLLNMEEGVDLILSNIEDNGKICIYGDYDADGITSTAVLMSVLSHLTDNLTYYIPSRFDEGYGLNCSALDKIKEDGANLVVTVDCGSVSYEEVEYAKSLGLKIMVTDHHTITDKVANCIVINPMQPDCPYPFKKLAGVGVAFKLAQAIAMVSGLPKSVVTKTLDLVAIGTIGDIVSLRDENRTLAKYGIRAVNISERPGVRQLLEGISLQQGGIGAESISFGIVPHINAAGRMHHARIAAELMLENDAQKADSRVSKLIECNNLRKSQQEKTFRECSEIVRERYMNDSFLVIHMKDAHEGITGIVAGKIREEFHKPAVIVTPVGEGVVKGTGRSIPGLNLYNVLKENEELFDRFGGHASACGFSMKSSNIEILRENLNRSMEALIAENPQLLTEKAEADLFLDAEDITVELAKEIALMEPFGTDNPKPLFAFRCRPENIRRMGNKGQYTKFTAILDNGRPLSCVVFKNAAQYDDVLQRGDYVSIIGTLECQTWNGKTYLQSTVMEIEQ
ncbi:MAG: single-stranded-DNA-specific exonuclease RecJ [Eubacteriaceae bacterium]|nr:single-stranded-DNA-specific exonuclease RecJ [Eubacteriaceae bacterium]